MTFGETRVHWPDDESPDHRVVSRCKFCGHTTEQIVPAGVDNVFDWVRVQHKSGCRMIASGNPGRVNSDDTTHVPVRPSRWERVKDVFRS